MQATMIVRQGIAPALNGEAEAPEHVAGAAEESLLDLARELGVTVEPMHPGTPDPELSRHFSITIPDTAAAEHVLSRIQRHEDVEAAYVKPTDALP
jgi:hypothetical protein